MAFLVAQSVRIAITLVCIRVAVLVVFPDLHVPLVSGLSTLVALVRSATHLHPLPSLLCPHPLFADTTMPTSSSSIEPRSTAWGGGGKGAGEG